MQHRHTAAAFFRYVPILGVALSVALFAACLFNDAYAFKSGKALHAVPSYFVLLTGWYGVLVGGNLGWLANPALLGGWLLFAARKRGPGVASTVLSLALMLRFLADPTVMLNEDAHQRTFDVYGAGYWLWLASAATLLLSYALAALPTDFIANKEGAP